MLGTRVLEPYLKPDWDPVLFSNSCYIAHLCGVDRERALELDAYLDPATEASPDWDLFTRFANAGVTPLHIPEVLYSWRIHASSTASNPGAKPYALDDPSTSARAIRRVACETSSTSTSRCTPTAQTGSTGGSGAATSTRGHSSASSSARPAESRSSRSARRSRDPSPSASTTSTNSAGSSRRAAEAGALVHLLNASAQILRPQWYWEALGLFELHADVAAVGGPIVRSDRIHSAGDVFGFGPPAGAAPQAGEPHDCAAAGSART